MLEGEEKKDPKNIQRRVTKLSQKTKEENELIKQKHMLKKKFLQSKLEPGHHQDIIKQSDFNVKPRPDYLQFFGSTDCKIADLNTNKNPDMGPGTYDAKIKRNINTATFVSRRKDDMFSGNSGPGPQEYF